MSESIACTYLKGYFRWCLPLGRNQVLHLLGTVSGDDALDRLRSLLLRSGTDDLLTLI